MREVIDEWQDNTLEWGVPTAAYVHIPFCRRRCFYCDFPISVVGDRARGETSGTMADYVDVLVQEILTTPPLERPLETIFFGGGTPSLLSVEQIARILNTLERQFGRRSQAEISIEIDPGTFDLVHLKGYVAAGINRVSLGVQSFDEELLRLCGRTHTPDDIDTAIAWIHQASLVNFSIDLISSLPTLTPEQWQDTLERAIALNPTHISVYDLTLEPGTVFGRRYQAGEAPLPSDDASAEMYRTAQRTLTRAGYDHYEISNYARPGYQCRHNRVYWENRPYYGFGMAAASYVNGQRCTRPRTRRGYAQWVEHLQANHGAIACPTTSVQDHLLDTVMLGLRLADGIPLGTLTQQFGQATLARLLRCLQPHRERGWVNLWQGDRLLPATAGFSLLPSSLLPSSNVTLRLSDPEGFLFSNEILSDVFKEFDG